MAVEARHLNLFPPQILTNRDLAMTGVEVNGNMFGAPETVFPVYGSAVGGGFPVKTPAMRCDSGLTYVPVVSRKRSREAVVNNNNNNNSPCGGGFTFLGEDISFQIQQQQLEIDRFIAQHTEKARLEIDERRRSYSRRIAAAVEENIMKKLRTREDEIEKIGKLNHALEERVKSLCVENQIWRDLAQSNEAAANELRSNLEQVLAQRIESDEHQQQRCDLTDDASSCCGSNRDDGRTLAESGSTDGGGNVSDGCIAPRNRMCRSCGREESCVLILPCRHLCLCTGCGATLHTCPVCKATKTASLHVNFSC